MIATIHDLATQAVYPRWWENLYYGVMPHYTNIVRRFLLKKVAKLIAVSQATQRELIGLGIKIPIKVVPNGVRGIFSPPAFPIRKKHILAMTDFSPRKNIGRTITAYANLPLGLRQKYPLVVVISMEAPRQLIERTAHQLGVSEFIKTEKQVSQKRLVQLYQEAVVFVYPSLYEGFGLPILEAMACGCPVVTSNYGAPREVAGGAAYLVDPPSISDITRALEKMLGERLVRQKFIKLGYSQAKLFSWETSARATLKIYEKLAAA
ncbi:MAG: glycosyltransferase family 4 protein [Patescibacteria group bacterium]